MNIKPGYDSLELKGKYYYLDGVRLARVTTILNELAKPQLIPWSRRQAIGSIDSTLQGYLKNGIYSFDEQQKLKMLEQADKEPDRKMNKAGDKGTEIHTALERYLIHGDIISTDLDVIKSTKAFIKYWDNSGYELVKSEMKVISKKWKYAGTLDLLAKKDDKYALIDFKTSGGVYDSHGMQCSAYIEALEEMSDIGISESKIFHLPSKNPGQFDIYDVDILKSWKCFEACLMVRQNKRGIIKKELL